MCKVTRHHLGQTVDCQGSVPEPQAWLLQNHAGGSVQEISGQLLLLLCLQIMFWMLCSTLGCWSSGGLESCVPEPRPVQAGGC